MANMIQMNIMQELGEKRIGTVMRVLTEGYDGDLGLYYGRSYADSPDIDGRITFTVSGRPPKNGDFVNVRITDCISCDLTGNMVEGS